MYFHCLTGDCPRQWVRWLPWAEYCYNTSYQSVLLETPFCVVYGCDLPILRSYEWGDARVPAVDTAMADRDSFLADIRKRFLQAHEYAKRYYNANHRDMS